MTTSDAFLGGKLTLQQPEKGFRAGLDSVMLAAAVPAVTGETVLELGSGAGVAALCLAKRVHGVRVLGLEIQADLVALATANTEHNKLIEWVLFLNAAVEAPPEGMTPNSFDHVMMNPPFFVEGTDDAPPGLARATAHIADAEALARWTKCARIYLKSKGRLTAILPAERLPDMLAALEKGFGAIDLFPLWSRPGVSAKRVLLTARMGSRTPLTLKPGLVLHAPDAKYTPEAEAILRDGAALNLSPPVLTGGVPRSGEGGA
ncbi:tRNA1(Val) (adenine(37)-N6)-methyltransferase [Alphaproteobacteria bacterium SO-S41]|nr:tRNA1(Val) (adenine(37)-N6)-methyltransferase [Alphaproteobacteria bacterium SO-S41]